MVCLAQWTDTVLQGAPRGAWAEEVSGVASGDFESGAPALQPWAARGAGSATSWPGERPSAGLGVLAQHAARSYPASLLGGDSWLQGVVVFMTLMQSWHLS